MASREQIIKRAAEMIVELGVKSLRVDDVAQDLAMSKRTLYEIFADKRELMYHSIKYLFNQEAEQVLASVDTKSGGIPALFEMFDLMAKASSVRQRIMENLRKFYPELFEQIMTENRDYGLAMLRDRLNQLIEEGLVAKTVNVDLSVTMFYYTSMGLLRRQGQLVLPEGVTEADAFRYTIVNFFRGIATLKGVEQIDNYIAEKQSK
ncbi:MAG: TetR/AcrR family transcriptional regulator [Alistipes sp.]|nr:TetR/AcrR family transcriptional regulator [Alistipes sp.]